MKTLFKLLCAIIVLSACGKFRIEDSTISGQAVNLLNEEALSGYNVVLLETETPSKPFSPVIITEIESAITDELGRFQMNAELKKQDRFSYSVLFDRGENLFVPDGWTEQGLGPSVSEVPISKESVNDVTLELAPLGKVKISVTNNSNTEGTAEVYLVNPWYETKKLNTKIGPSETSGNADFIETLATDLTAKLVFTSGVIADTQLVDFTLQHNEEKEVSLSYP